LLLQHGMVSGLFFLTEHVYEVVSKIFRTGAAIYKAVVLARSTGRTTMSSESVCQVARSWVNVGRFDTRLFGVEYVTCRDFHDGLEKGTGSVRRGAHTSPKILDTTTLIYIYGTS
jgi:hypothetical protein